MKKIEDLMAELGFNKRAPASVQKAFIRHLVKAAEVVQANREQDSVPPLSEKSEKKAHLESHQLTLFNFAKEIKDN